MVPVLGTVKPLLKDIRDRKLVEVFEAGATVNLETLIATGLVNSSNAKVKILGNGDIAKSLMVSATKFSQSAKDKIIAAGGTVEEKI